MKNALFFTRCLAKTICACKNAWSLYVLPKFAFTKLEISPHFLHHALLRSHALTLPCTFTPTPTCTLITSVNMVCGVFSELFSELQLHGWLLANARSWSSLQAPSYAQISPRRNHKNFFLPLLECFLTFSHATQICESIPTQFQFWILLSKEH
jgi:hypothetical protein